MGFYFCPIRTSLAVLMIVWREIGIDAKIDRLFGTFIAGCWLLRIKLVSLDLRWVGNIVILCNYLFIFYVIYIYVCG